MVSVIVVSLLCTMIGMIGMIVKFAFIVVLIALIEIWKMKRTDDTLQDISTVISDSWNILNEKIDLSDIRSWLLSSSRINLLDGDSLVVSYVACALDYFVKNVDTRERFRSLIEPFLFSLTKENDEDIFIF